VGRRDPRAGGRAGGGPLSENAIRDLLNRHKWESRDLDRVVVTYRHRGAPGDEAQVRGSDVLDVGPSFLALRGGTMIPYHRVLRVQVGDSVAFQRADAGL